MSISIRHGTLNTVQYLTDTSTKSGDKSYVRLLECVRNGFQTNQYLLPYMIAMEKYKLTRDGQHKLCSGLALTPISSLS